MEGRSAAGGGRRGRGETFAIDGMDVDEFIARNADPIWLHMNGRWEDMPPSE